jgi:two-component system, NarL family, nitrate/nitrite response regulator NarL
MIRIAIADDQPIALDGLDALLRAESDLKVIARCTTPAQAVEAVRTHRPDVLVLDLAMGRGRGLEVLRGLREDDGQPPRIVVFTQMLSEDAVLEAMHLGVAGIVLKTMEPRLLIQCIRKVAAGGQWLETTAVANAVRRMMRRQSGEHSVRAALTRREFEIALAAASSATLREVADRLCISEGTVKAHLHAVYSKLELRGRVDLAIYLRDKGLL